MEPNPWLDLATNFQRKNFIIKEEQKVVKDFNETVAEEYSIHTNIFPAPFMGNINTAPIVILVLNPGYDKKEAKNNYYKEYEGWWMKQIQHISPIPNLPLFCLDDNYISKSPYWFQKLKHLINITGKEKVAQNVAKVQFFPYHSRKFKVIPKRILKNNGFQNYLPSQEYNFELVKKAIERGATIIIPRSKKYWCEAIPELKSYDKIFSTKSYGNIIFSRNNLGDIDFNTLIEILEN